MSDWLTTRKEAADQARDEAVVGQALGMERITTGKGVDVPGLSSELSMDVPKGSGSGAESGDGVRKTDLTLSGPPGPTTPAERVTDQPIHSIERKTITVDIPEVSAIRQQYHEMTAKFGTGEAVAEEVGKAGRSFAEALHPGVVVAGRAIGLDEEQADAMATGFVEFLAGLPGKEESDATAGFETALAAIPLVGASIKGGKVIGKAGEELAPLIKQEFKKAVEILKSERGSVPTGGKGVRGTGEKPAPPPAPLNPEQLALDEKMSGFRAHLPDTLKRLQKQRNAPRSDVQVAQEATALQETRVTWEHVLGLPPGSIARDSEAKAIANTFKAGSKPTIALAQEIVNNPTNLALQAQLLRQLSEVEQGVNAVTGIFTETGRAERQLNQWLPNTAAAVTADVQRPQIADPYISQWLDFFEHQRALAEIGQPARTPVDLATVIASLKTPEQLVKLARDMAEGRMTAGDWWSSWVYFTALSNPATHVANLSGLPLMAATTIVERALAKKIGPEAAREVILDDRLGLGIVKGEPERMLLGAINGLHNAMAAVSAVAEHGAEIGAKGIPPSAMTGKDRFQAGLGSLAELLNALESAPAGKLGEAGQTGRLRRLTAQRAGQEGVLGDTIETLGLMIESPKLALTAEDMFMKTIFRDMQRAATAHRLATFKAGESIGPVYEAEFARLMESPTKGMLAEMDEFADRNAFSLPLEGRMASFEQAFGSPWMKPFIMFIKTTTRIAEEGAQRIPGIGMMVPQWIEDVVAGGARRSLAIAKQKFGVGVALVAAALSLEGRITGNGPANPAMKAVWDTEYPSLSFRVGETWYQFNRNDPLALWLGHMADFVTMMEELPDAVAQDMAVGYTMAFVNNMASKTFSQSTADFFGLFKRRADESSVEQAQRVRTYLEQQAARVAVPGILYAVNRAYYDNIIREVRSLPERVGSRAPGHSEGIKPKLNYWGDVDIYETFGPEIASHIRTKRVLNDPINLEILKQKAELPMIPKTIEGQELTSDEIYDLKMIYAKVLKLPGPDGKERTLREALADTMALPEYVNAAGPERNNLMRATMLQTVAHAYMNTTLQIMGQQDVKFLKLKKQIALQEQMTGEPRENILNEIQRSLKGSPMPQLQP